MYIHITIPMFTDVVLAYKGLAKEKEALQASIQALTAVPASKAETGKKEESTSKKTTPNESRAVAQEQKDPLTVRDTMIYSYQSF